jgi:hypothetical protein
MTVSMRARLLSSERSPWRPSRHTATGTGGFSTDVIGIVSAVVPVTQYPRRARTRGGSLGSPPPGDGRGQGGSAPPSRARLNPSEWRLGNHLVRGRLPEPSILVRGANVKDCDRCGCSGTTDNQTVSTLFLRMIAHSEPCYGTIAPALPLVLGSAEMQVPDLRDIRAQTAAFSVRKRRVGWSGVHHLPGRCAGRAAGDPHMPA